MAFFRSIDYYGGENTDSLALDITKTGIYKEEIG
ncbi:MAG: hypothetical protein ACI8ZM_002936 [Crocinitomix sp.]|jgi:hypothetical protein